MTFGLESRRARCAIRVALGASLAVACSRSERAAPVDERRGDERDSDERRREASAVAPSPSASVPPTPGASAGPVVGALPRGVEVQPIVELMLDGVAQEGVVVRVELARASLEPRAVPERRLAAFAAEPSLVLAVNAGFFEPDGAPSGLLAGEAVRFGLPSPRGGSGLALVRERRAVIEPFTEPFTLGAPVELAVQSGPRLLEADGSAGIRSDDGQRAARTVLCVAEGGRRVDLILLWTRGEAQGGPGLFSLARALAAPLVKGDARRCEQALNLDGGPSTGFVYGSAVKARPAPEHLPRGPVPWALSVRSRAATNRPL